MAACCWASRYRNESLGVIDVSHKDGVAAFDFGALDSDVASRKNDDGTLSMVTISPGEGGIEFVVGSKEGKRTLTLRDAQHEYVFLEEPAADAAP